MLIIPVILDGYRTLKDKTFKDQMGNKATFTREKISDQRELALKVNGMLRDIGKIMAPKKDNKPEYLGSMASHMYKIPHPDPKKVELIFVEQTLLQDCPEPVASEAWKHIRGTSQEFYGHERQVRRSGL